MRPDLNLPKIHNLDLKSFQIQPGRLGSFELVSLILSLSGGSAVCLPFFLVSLFLLNGYKLINLPKHSIEGLTKLKSPQHLISEKLVEKSRNFRFPVPSNPFCIKGPWQICLSVIEAV